MKSLLRLLIVLCVGSISASANEESPSIPNVVIFIADDLSWHDVACFGGPTDAKTPHLDLLASQGMKLNGFFSPAAVCSPTRQALLTGMYPIRIGAYPNHSVVRDGTRSLPHHLKSIGYRTGCFGKTHFGPPKSFPFDHMAGTKGGANNAKNGNEEADDGGLDFSSLKQFVTTKNDQPFCAYIAPHEPHAPWTKGDQSAFDPATLQMPPYLVDTPETRKALAAYYAEVAELDAEVGRVMQILEETGHTNDTMFVFFSEQGNAMPHGKWTLYNPGIRVAAIARWPGKIQPGSECSALIQYVDVLPTVIAAAGSNSSTFDTGCPDANGDTHFDGRSFLSVLVGDSDHHRDIVFAQHTTRGIIQGSEAYASRAAFDGRWKLITNLHADSQFHNVMENGPVLSSWRDKGRLGDSFAAEQATRYATRPAVELYDLQSDPWELHNLADQLDSADTIRKLQDQLNDWMQQQGDQGDVTERKANEHQAGRRKKKV